MISLIGVLIVSNMNYDGGWGPGIYPDPDKYRLNFKDEMLRSSMEYAESHKYHTISKCDSCGKETLCRECIERSSFDNGPGNLKLVNLCDDCKNQMSDKYI